MSERTWWETIRAEGQELLNKVEELIREGNVRRIVIKQQGRSIAEFPLMVGVVAVTPDRVETPEEVAGVIRTAMAYVEPERLLPCSNCGMTPIAYETALGKIHSIVAGADLVRRSL